LILLFVSYSLISFNFYLFYFPGAAAEPLGIAREEPLGLRGAQVGNLCFTLLTINVLYLGKEHFLYLSGCLDVQKILFKSLITAEIPNWK